MQGLKSRILSNLFSHYAVQFLAVGLSFFLIPYIVRVLGKEAFGTAILAESVIIFFELANVGIRNAMARHATVALGRGETDFAKHYLASGKYLLWGVSLLVLLVGSTLSFFFPVIFRVPEAQAAQSRWLFFCLTVGFCLQVACAHFWAMLYAKQRVDWINFGNALQVIARGVLVVWVFGWVAPTWLLAAYGLILLVSRVLELVYVYFRTRLLFPGWKIRLRDFSREKAAEIASLGTFMSVSRISQLLHRNTDHVLINIFWGPQYNALYEVSLKFAQLLQRFFANTTWMLGSSFTELKAKGDEPRFRLLFFFYSKAMAIVTMPLSLGIIFFAEPLVLAWVGPDFLPAAKVVPFHTVQLLWALTFASCHNVTLALARVKIPSLVSLFAAVVNVALSILFGWGMGMGLKGIALGTLAVSLGNSLLFVPYYACRISGVSFRRYWTRVFLYPFFWACVVFGAGLVFMQMSGAEPVSLPALGVGTLCSAVYAMGSYLLLLDAHEKEQVRKVFTIK